MARQFREQLEEEAHNLETKVNIDPGIDTSLTRSPPRTSGTTATSRRNDRRVTAACPWPKKSSIHPTTTCTPSQAPPRNRGRARRRCADRPVMTRRASST